jgi:hypothetical protein
MPNRILRDWTDSEVINKLSVHAERFFTRLIMAADDYGCYHASPILVKARLFPHKTHEMREADISRLLDECQKAGLIALYEVNGKKYLEINEFNQRLRIKKRQFPERPKHDGHHDRMKRREEEIETEGEEKPPPTVYGNFDRSPVIPTIEQVRHTFKISGGTDEMADKFFAKYEATGWYLNGSAIKNYSSLVQNYVSSWKSYGKQEADPTKVKLTLK